MRPYFVLSALLLCSMVSCVDQSATELSGATHTLTAAQRRAHATAIRDVAAEEGLTNAAVLGGIAQSETGLVHCWSDATWACKGPASTSCDGGPVIAGSGDGDCSLEQGGLGMFQFDAGTYADTIARDGSGVLTLEGNIAKAVEFITDKVIDDIKGVKTKADALAWINAVPMVAGDERIEQWASLLACRYNGCCNSSSTCTKRRADYRDNAIDIYNEFGEDFWKASGNSDKGDDEGGCSSSRGAGIVSLMLLLAFSRRRKIQ